MRRKVWGSTGNTVQLPKWGAQREASLPTCNSCLRKWQQGQICDCHSSEWSCTNAPKEDLTKIQRLYKTFLWKNHNGFKSYVALRGLACRSICQTQQLCKLKISWSEKSGCDHPMLISELAGFYGLFARKNKTKTKPLDAVLGSQFNSYNQQKRLKNHVPDAWSQNQFYLFL